LQHLDLAGCDITDAGLVHLQQLPLQHLVLYQCTAITDGGLEHLQHLPLQLSAVQSQMVAWCTCSSFPCST
jgi:hypothetical protein